MPKKSLPTEHQECCSFIEYCAFDKLVNNFILHIPNERKGAIAGMFLKRAGVRSGVPDYFLPIPRGGYHGLWLEMKRRDQVGRKKRPEQLDWQKKLRENGYVSEFVYGWEDCVRVMKLYLEGKWNVSE